MKRFSLPGRSNSTDKGPSSASSPDRATPPHVLEVILVHGLLQKKSPTIFGLWQTRWFELTQTDLMYYSSQTDGVPKGVLPLHCVREVERCEDDRCFNLHLENLKPSEPRRTFELQAANGVLRERWARALTTLTRGNDA